MRSLKETEMKKLCFKMIIFAVIFTFVLSLSTTTAWAANQDKKQQGPKAKGGLMAKIKEMQAKKKSPKTDPNQQALPPKTDLDNNPPGAAGGAGTNWENPPGEAGGPGASPNKRPLPPKAKADLDNNPPGAAGGAGTNWENPPGKAGGPGASPNRRPFPPRRDLDNNPPGAAGGAGTNWENPPGEAGGPGASPNKRPLPPKAKADLDDDSSVSKNGSQAVSKGKVNASVNKTGMKKSSGVVKNQKKVSQ
jgi:hypothetical protein